MSFREIIAIILAATFIWAPLGVIPAETIIFGHGAPSTQNNADESRNDFFEFLTIALSIMNVGIIAFQAVIFDRQRILMEGQLKATETAAEAAVAAQRPWIKITSVTLEGFIGINTGNQLVISATVSTKNVGSTPATKSHNNTIVCFEHQSVKSYLDSLTHQIPAIRKFDIGNTIFPNDAYEFNFNAWSALPEKTGSANIIIVGIVFYNFGRTQGITTFAYILRHKTYGFNFLNMLQPGGNFRSDEIVVEKMKFIADHAT